MSSVETSSNNNNSCNPTTTTTTTTTTLGSTTSSHSTSTSTNNNNGVYNFNGNTHNIKIQHYFNYSTIMRDREACSSFLDYLTNVTHCDENLLFLLHLDNIKFMKTVPIMMEQTQTVIDTYVKLESNKELNITDKIRSTVIQQYEELKNLFPNCDYKGSTHDLTQEFIQGKIQQIFNELVVQINLQLKQDSFESYLSSEVFEKFIIKKIREKSQQQQEKHQEKQKKKRASSLFPTSPNAFDVDNYSFRDSDAADGYNMYDDSDSGSGLGANLMKRFVGGLLKGGAALQQAVNNHTSSVSGSFDDVSSSSNSLTSNSTDSLGCASSNGTVTSSTTTASTCGASDAEDQHVGNFHIKHHRIKSFSNQIQENSNDTVEIMKNIIQDLYKQLIQKDQEIKKLQEAIKQHTQLMGLGGERKAKPLPTAPVSPQPTSLLTDQLTSPRKIPKPLPSLHNRMSLNVEQAKEIKNMNFSNVTTTPTEHSKSLHQLNTNNNTSTTNNSYGISNKSATIGRSSGRTIQPISTSNTTTNGSGTTGTVSSMVRKEIIPSKDEASGSPPLRRQTTQTLIVGSKKMEDNTPTSPSKTKKVLDISSSSENLNDKLPITQRLQFFEKLNATTPNSPPTDSSIKRFSQTVSNK